MLASVGGVLAALLWLSTGAAAAADIQEVVPSCSPDASVCEFSLHITQQETMVWYNRSLGKGYPVVAGPGGALYRRLADNCSQIEALSQQQLEEVVTADGRPRVAYFINKQMPGPNIVVYKGQQVAVHVHNALLQEGTSIHWHGQTQRGTPWMDGVAGVSHCPIQPGQSFTYRFLATETGTHWYHSHYGTQRTDGLYGALIVLEADDRDANRTPKEAANRIKRNKREGTRISPDDMLKLHAATDARTGPRALYAGDYILSTGDWYGESSSVILTRYLSELQRFTPGYHDLDLCHIKTQQADGSEVGTIPFESALINGKGRYYRHEGNDSYVADIDTPLEVFPVTQGQYYNFRVINPSLNFAFKISIDMHQLVVTASDGNPLQPVVADSLVVHGGERYDFYVYASQPTDNYWLRLHTTEKYNGKDYEWDHPARVQRPGIGRAILRYSGAPKREPTTSPLSCTENKRCKVVNCPFPAYPHYEYSDCINYDQLQSLTPSTLPPLDESTFQEHFLNFHFPKDGPGLLRSMVNGRQFVPPSTPPQVVGHANYEHPCTEECEDEPCHCTHQVDLTHGNMVQLTLFSHVTPVPWAGVPASAHPVHIHGHHVHVVKVGYPDLDPVTKRYVNTTSDIHCPTGRCSRPTWSNATWMGGHVPKVNEVTPPVKDTVIVPAGGYVVIRFMADNPGWWLVHCHVELHQVEGMALLLQEGDPGLMKPPPPAFPTCSSFTWGEEDFWKALESVPATTQPTAGGLRPQRSWSVMAATMLMTLVLAA